MGHKSTPTSVQGHSQHKLCCPTVPTNPVPWCWEDWGLWWCVHTCSLAITAARVTPAAQGVRGIARTAGPAGREVGEKRREREKKSGRTHPLTGKGVVREVANSTEEFRPFLGKPQPGPGALLAAPSRGQLSHRGAQRVPPGVSQVSLQPPSRAGSGSSCEPQGYKDGAPRPGLALMAASQKQPGHAGAGTTPRPRKWLCPE